MNSHPEPHADPADLAALLRSAVGDPARVRTRASQRAAAAHDASHYLLAPQAVVRAASADEVAALMRATRRAGIPLTLRSGGTSLSGQAGGDGVLVDVRTHWRDLRILDDGRRVSVQPGLTVRQVNARLARHNRRLGPDPASESACTVGGVVANNSSGMNCGTRDNAYRTMESLRFVLPSGTLIDSGRHDADRELLAREPELHAGLLRLHARIHADRASRATVERLFSLKNTMGYGLNAFLDHSRPVDILSHLLIGSEGTLGFVAEATFRTVPLLPHTATGLLVLRGLAEATDALPALLAAGARTAELLDAAALRVAQLGEDAPAGLRKLPIRQHAALLVEFAEEDAEELETVLRAARPVLERTAAALPVTLTRDARLRARLWHLRKGLYTAVAAARRPGTTALLEDIAVPLPRLTDTCEGLIGLFERHGYQDAVIFGHARDGNVHFMLSQDFDRPDEIDRYARFTDDMVDLVLDAGGTLKAEHGTGRVMAPYVRRQYGDELYQVMREIKQLCDPAATLNPGVVLDDDPAAHLRHLKRVPQVDPAVDRCVECGYCEPVCPSADATTTPRQRIALLREIADADAAGDRARARELQADYAFDAVDSCAADSLCVTACPVAIDTGAVMKRLRADRHGPLAQTAGRVVADHWGTALHGVRTALTVAHRLPAPVVRAATGAARGLGAGEVVPPWRDSIPRAGRRRPTGRAPEGATAVLFATCVGAVFEPAGPDHAAGATRALLALCERADVQVAVPAGLDRLCCGTPWQSKGFTDGHRAMAARTLAALWQTTDAGRLPVVSDATSCTHGLHQLTEVLPEAERARYQDLRFVDAVTFAVQHLLPALPPPRRLASLALHPTCSAVHLGLDTDLRTLAGALAAEVTVPDSWGCCAYAGTAACSTPSSPLPRPSPRPPSSPRATSTATSRPTTPASWA
ncbi:FAD-binding and (Fe-S)-binding domain-containing protein [Kitasatospora paranensis]|uniref:FAD-binding and (Fe-S)-binding domain-containing protein n=1 Tax=Kitasatospora paranensis TaxID=258053 RepID=UPI0031F0D1CF